MFLREVTAFWNDARASGVRRGSIVTGTPCGHTGSVEYKPLSDRIDGPQKVFLTHNLACGLGLPVIDFWSLEITCASQHRKGGANHMNLHYCVPGIPDIEWQLLIRFLAKMKGHTGSLASYNASRCQCPPVNHRRILGCGNHLRHCAVDAAAERMGRLQMINSKLHVGAARRTPEKMKQLCGTNACTDLNSALNDSRLVGVGGAAPFMPK